MSTPAVPAGWDISPRLQEHKSNAKSFYNLRKVSSDSNSEHTLDNKPIDDEIMGIPINGIGFHLIQKEHMYY